MYRHIINMNPIENYHQCGAWLYGFLYFWTLRMPCHKIDRDVVFLCVIVTVLSTHLSTIYFPETYILDTLMHYFVWTSNKGFCLNYYHKNKSIVSKSQWNISRSRYHTYSWFVNKINTFLHHFYLPPAFRGRPRHETQWGPRIREISL